MLCHECLISRESREAVGLCKFCFVGLCKPHLLELHRRRSSVPMYSCGHRPWEAAPGGSWDDRPWKARLPD